MPSEKILNGKQAYVEELRAKIANSKAGVVVSYHGITVDVDTKLRTELRKAGADYAVVKNTMLRLAIKGTELESMETSLTGSTAFAIAGEDIMAPAKILNKYAEASKGAFAIKTGYMDGKVMNATDMVAVANLPSRDGLLSMLLSALTGNLRGLAVALNKVAEQKNEVA